MKSIYLVCLFAMFTSAIALAKTNPVPLINQPLLPEAATPGGKGFTLTVNGTGFVSGSVVNWNGGARATTYVNRSQLKASILASDIATFSSAAVTVTNPAPGGGTSNVAFFEVTIPTGPTSPLLFATSTFGVGAGPNAISTGDFNRDGKLDMAVANVWSGDVSVLLGSGDGTFQSAVSYGTGSPGSVAVGDFNRDGKLDLVVSNVFNNSFSVLFGNGDGTFQSANSYGLEGMPEGLAVGDFNRDGNLDLAVGIEGDNFISILLGNGDGTFQTPVDYPAEGPYSVAVGDFNGDGILDLAVGNRIINYFSLLIGNGDGTFQPEKKFYAGPIPQAVAAGDFNHDGKLDIAAANDGDAVSILLGDGKGSFGPAVSYQTNPNSDSVALGDLNGDGILDLIVGSDGNNGSFSVLLGNGDGTFQPAVNYGVVGYPVSAVVGDFNGDGRPDLAVTDYQSQTSTTVSVFLQVPTVSLSTNSLIFGDELLGTKSAPQTVKLTNTSVAVPLAIASIAITGADSKDFSQLNNCGSVLPPGKTCKIKVTFAPTQLGSRTASLTITDNAPDSPQSVSLSGTGVTSGPNATLSPTDLTFASQLVHTSSPPQPVMLSNYGTKTLDITDIKASPSIFTQTNNCHSRLPPERQCTINVTFTPTKSGETTGTLSVTDNAPGSPQKVSLKGEGTVVKLDPGSLDFGNVTVGQKSSPQNTILTNVRKTKLHITNIAITGTDAGDFSQQHNCPDPGYLGGGKSCTITVTFQPTQAGLRSADVSVSDDGGGSPQQVSLSGTGTCGGRCNQGRCPTGCRCFFGYCRTAGLPTISGTLDTLWGKETASERACAARPAVAFACQQ